MDCKLRISACHVQVDSIVLDLATPSLQILALQDHIAPREPVFQIQEITLQAIFVILGTTVQYRALLELLVLLVLLET